MSDYQPNFVMGSDREKPFRATDEFSLSNLYPGVRRWPTIYLLCVAAIQGFGFATVLSVLTVIIVTEPAGTSFSLCGLITSVVFVISFAPIAGFRYSRGLRDMFWWSKPVWKINFRGNDIEIVESEKGKHLHFKKGDFEYYQRRHAQVRSYAMPLLPTLQDIANKEAARRGLLGIPETEILLVEKVSRTAYRVRVSTVSMLSGIPLPFAPIQVRDGEVSQACD